MSISHDYDFPCKFLYFYFQLYHTNKRCEALYYIFIFFFYQSLIKIDKPSFFATNPFPNPFANLFANLFSNLFSNLLPNLFANLLPVWKNHMATSVLKKVTYKVTVFGYRLRQLSPSDSLLPFKLSRRQFPIKLCFAMTLNKAQGQSINNLGV